MESNKGLTLIELLIVIVIVAILGIAVVMVINPTEILRETRDAQRLAEIKSIDSGINIGKSLNPNFDASVATSTVYISLPDNASSTCGSYSLPSLPAGWSYKCVTEANLRKVDSNGWIPINFTSIVTGPPFPSLPIDPVNTAEGGLYYTYVKGSWELTTVFESSKYQTQYPDGYKVTSVVEAGISLTPQVVVDRASPPVQLVYSTYLGSTNEEYGYAIALDSGGNAYVTGQTSSANFPTLNAYDNTLSPSDAFITKFNSSGTGLVYSTFLGGSAGEGGYAIAVDSAGNAYVTGYTSSNNFPVTTGAYNESQPGSDDVFVTKLNSSGSALLYSTYLGGTSNEYGNAIALDSSVDIYVTGYTLSPSGINDFPTTFGAYQEGPGDLDDVFVSKIHPAAATSTDLVYSTYLADNFYDYGRAIAVDSSGNAFVAGYSDSTFFPCTTLCAAGGFGDAFVVKLNSNATGLIYSSWFGGSGPDDVYGLAIDSGGNAYITGQTYSNNYPTTPGAYKESWSGVSSDAFITKLNSAGDSYVYSTFLGGSDEDISYGIALDSGNNVFVVGYTYSNNFPTTLGAYQTTNRGLGDAFVSKLNSSGSSLLYSTYLGGTGTDTGNSIVVDSGGKAYVTGYTLSTNFPVTVGAFQTTFGGGSFLDAFVAKINPQ